MTNKKGFTLIELLIVIAIIGILAAALIPNILNAPAAARDTAKVSGMQDIVTALEQFYTSTGNYPTGAGCLTAYSASLAPYFKGQTLPTASGNNIAACTSPYYYVKLNTPYNYAVLAAVEKSGTDVKKYTDKPATWWTSSQDYANVVKIPPAAGSTVMYIVQ